MRANGWNAASIHAAVTPTASDEAEEGDEGTAHADGEAAGRDQIGRLISVRVKMRAVSRAWWMPYSRAR